MRTRKNCVNCNWTDNWNGNCPKCGHFIFRRIFKTKDGEWFQMFKGKRLPIIVEKINNV